MSVSKNDITPLPRPYAPPTHTHSLSLSLLYTFPLHSVSLRLVHLQHSNVSKLNTVCALHYKVYCAYSNGAMALLNKISVFRIFFYTRTHTHSLSHTHTLSLFPSPSLPPTITNSHSPSLPPSCLLKYIKSFWFCSQMETDTIQAKMSHAPFLWSNLHALRPVNHHGYNPGNFSPKKKKKEKRKNTWKIKFKFKFYLTWMPEQPWAKNPWRCRTPCLVSALGRWEFS